MKKTKQVLLMLMSMLVGIGLSYALDVQQKINNTVAYIQKMIFTTNGNDTGQEKVVIDGDQGSITMSGALNITTGALKDRTVVTDDLVDGAVNSSKLATGAVTTLKIADGAVTNDKIGQNAVASRNIITGAVGTRHIATGAITQEKIANGAITHDKIATGAISQEHIADGSITTRMIQTGAITIDKLAFSARSTLQDLADGGERVKLTKDNCEQLGGKLLLVPSVRRYACAFTKPVVCGDSLGFYVSDVQNFFRSVRGR